MFQLSAKRPLIMGIVNVTPDSFYDGGKYNAGDSAISHALKLVSEGADIIDVGAESTRPGSLAVGVEEELNRLIPVITGIRAKSDVVISVDTSKALVADKCLAAGANMINDVSGFGDSAMVSVATKYNCPAIIMHMKGTPRSMQENPSYVDVVSEVYSFLESRSKMCSGQVIVDPGIGFGKRLDDNLKLLKSLNVFKKLGPVLIGTSMKSFHGIITGRKVDERLSETIGSNVYAYLKGADILRVHNVREIKMAIDVVKAINEV